MHHLNYLLAISREQLRPEIMSLRCPRPAVLARIWSILSLILETGKLLLNIKATPLSLTLHLSQSMDPLTHGHFHDFQTLLFLLLSKDQRARLYANNEMPLPVKWGIFCSLAEHVWKDKSWELKTTHHTWRFT